MIRERAKKRLVTGLFGIVAGFIGSPLAYVAAAEPTDFTVKAGESGFRLTEARGKYVALHFLLKSECPNCLEHVREYMRKGPTVAGVVHVFLKPDSQEEIMSWANKLGKDGVYAPIYRDADDVLARDFKIPEGLSTHGQSVHYPTLILIGPDGREVFRYVGKDQTDWLPFEQFARKVAERSQTPGIKQYNLVAGKPALQGYDPVAYVETARAVKGLSEVTSVYHGVTYHFATEGNRERFAENPVKYLPAYGGWCATAMAEGRKVDIDPANFKVTQGRVFLFYKGWLGDALKEWNKDEPGLTRKADAHWNKIAPEESREASKP